MFKLSWVPDCQSTLHAKKLVSKAQVWGGRWASEVFWGNSNY